MDAYKVLLGEILIQRKRITREQLDGALQIQKQKGGLIGEILVGMGLLDERDIVVALVIQCGLPYIAVNKYAIDPEIVRRSEEHTSELQSLRHLVCRLLLE